MKIVFRLALAYAWQHPARVCLAALSVVAAACMVVWVVSGYDALASQFDDMAAKYMGRYHVVVVPDSSRDPMIPAELLTALKQDLSVAEADSAMQARITVAAIGPDGRPRPAAMGLMPGADPSQAGPPGRGGPGMRGRGMGGPGGPGMGRGRGMGGPEGGPGMGGPGMGRGRGRGMGGPPAADSAAAAQGPGGPAAKPGAPGGRPSFGPTLVGTDARQPPYNLVAGRWIDQKQTDDEAVISQNSAQNLGLSVGDPIQASAKGGDFRLKIVGIVEEMPMSVAMATRRGTAPAAGRGLPAAALYVPIPLAAKITGAPAKTNMVNLVLAEGVDRAKFCAAWGPRLAQFTPPATLFDLEELKTAMAERGSGASAKNQAYAATGLALLAGFFIIFATLSMGVSERVRQLAILRAVAWTQGQIALLIVFESLTLAVIGWLGGLVAGWILLRVAQAAQPDLFPNGATLGTWCVLLAAASAFGGALAASILPAWRAMRVQPLEAMAPARYSRIVRRPMLPVIVGLALITLNPLLVFIVPMPEQSRYTIYAMFGCPAMALGFLLLVPTTVVMVERVFGPAVARLLRVDPRLLRTQLSSSLWRTIGTGVALTIGLGLYVATQIWGYSMLGPFVPGNWVPQVLVCLPYGGLPDSEVAAVRQIPGIQADECLPLAVEQPQLTDDITHAEERATVARQDNVVLIGLDPSAGLGGADPLLKLQFVAGSRDEAVARLKQGRACGVPDHFLRATGLKLGDRFRMTPPEAPDKPVEYTIAGAVELPGWHWMTKLSGLRRRAGRSAAMIFAPYNDVRRDFRIEKTNFLWFNLQPGATLEQVGAAFQPIAERNRGLRQPVNDQGTWAFGAAMFGPYVRVTTADDIRSRIGTRADGMIWAMSRLPLVTLLVAALGVMNAVLASVRARRWEMGVMRAVGITPMALVRLILAEGLLIGAVACLLSLVFGITAGWCGVGISQYASFFGGLNPTLVIPWLHLAIGLAATLALCLAAAAWPAVATGRAEPLELLQAGRTAM
jgi:putative ABC transport system permease protein